MWKSFAVRDLMKEFWEMEFVVKRVQTKGEFKSKGNYIYWLWSFSNLVSFEDVFKRKSFLVSLFRKIKLYYFSEVVWLKYEVDICVWCQQHNIYNGLWSAEMVGCLLKGRGSVGGRVEIWFLRIYLKFQKSYVRLWTSIFLIGSTFSSVLGEVRVLND